MSSSSVISNHSVSRAYNFPLLTVELILCHIIILTILAKHWAVLVAERGGPYSLVVLIIVAFTLTWQWADVWQVKKRVDAGTANVEVSNAAQRGFFFASTIVALLTVAFGLFLNHVTRI